MTSHTVRVGARACFCTIMVYAFVACGDGSALEPQSFETPETFSPPPTADAPHDAVAPPSQRAPSDNTVAATPPRITQSSFDTFVAVPLWAPWRARCGATEGLWHTTLAVCTCPVGTVFSPRQGCFAAPPLGPRSRACTGPWAQLPTRCLKELTSAGLALHLNWGGSKRAKNAFLAHAQGDWSRFFASQLSVPAAPSTLHLTNALRYHTDTLAAWIAFDASDVVTPMVAPFSPRAALHEGDDINVGSVCAAALQQTSLTPGSITPLCESFATTLAAVRAPHLAHAAQLSGLVVDTNAQAALTLVTARYTWNGLRSDYRMPWQNEVAAARHIVTVDAQGNRFVGFLSAAGSLHAMAVAPAGQTEPIFFDDAGKMVH